MQRQVEASYLRLPYSLDREKTEGRIVIEAAWKPYTQRELWEREQEIEGDDRRGGGVGAMRLARAVDLWMGELARAGRTQGTRDSYSRGTSTS